MSRAKKDKEIVYSEIDVDGLAETLAKADWQEQTLIVPSYDLYEMSTVVDPVTHEVKLIKEVRGKWSGLLFDLKSAYIELIDKFSKKQ